MKTEKLYVKNVYLKEADMVLCHAEEHDGIIKAVFYSTIFFPTGGGQLADGGSIAGFDVIDVKENKENGEIIHSLKWPVNSEKEMPELLPGQSLRAFLDWEKRFSHMQMHCGEHLLSGAFLKLYGGANKGFHMGEDYVTIDIDLPLGEMTQEMARGAETLANEYVALNIPVETRWFPTAADAMSLPCRKDIKFGENISVVLIGSPENPADCCACCGTHPSSTGQVGLVKITHMEKYKGMTRFYVKCGRKALEDYTALQDIAESLGRHYSCEPASLENAVNAESKRQEELYKKYSTLKEHCIREAEAEILKGFSEEKASYYFEFDFLNADDLQSLARKLNINKLSVLASPKEKCIILASDGSFNCGKFIKDNAATFRCRGGGKNNMARAVFENASDLHAFCEQIQKSPLV